MAYIAPNSDVLILKGIPLDRSYNHTVRYTDSDTQYNQFKGFAKYTLDKYSYQRHGKGRIRVGILADNLYDCNYLMFKNTSYGSKWFYCFIDEVEYINDNATEIIYTIDVMQTWAFDYIVDDCFVEREHSETDVIGDNLVKENLELGEYTVINKTDVYYKYMVGGIILNKPLPTSFTIHLSGGHDVEYTISNQPYPGLVDTYNENGTMGGIAQGCYVVGGFPLCIRDINDYIYANRSSYALQNLGYNYDGSSVTHGDASLTLTRMIQYIVNSNIQDFSENNIIQVFQYPLDFATKTIPTSATGWPTLDIRAGSSYRNVYVNRPTQFVDPNSTAVYSSVKNNKMFTSPYIKIVVSNNDGNTAEYSFEDFKNKFVALTSGDANFTIVSTIAGNPTALLFPVKYKGVDNYYDCGITLSGFPIPAYSGNTYVAWLQQNSLKMTMGLTSNIISGAVSVASAGIVGSVSANPNIATANMTRAAINTGGNFYNDVLSLIGTVEDLRATPPQTHGNISNDAINPTVNRSGFSIYVMGVRKEFAEIIDNYFSTFGYAVKRVKTPVLFKSGGHPRVYWNYLKTVGCLIHAKSGSGLPAGDEERIANILDNGITFWANLQVVGQYNLTNSIST